MLAAAGWRRPPLRCGGDGRLQPDAATEAGHPADYDKGLTDLIGQLSTRSEAFRTRRAAHNVRLHRTGFKQLYYPVVGHLDLTDESMEFPGDPWLTMHVYSAESGSPSADALKLLASCDQAAAAPDQASERLEGSSAERYRH
jgi:hypothetical protein